MILEMENICKDFPMGNDVNHILKNVNLSVDEGDYLAIMGPSGSGKTTLMNIIGCLDQPTSGTYYLENKSIPDCSSNELAEIRNQKIGFVFQSYYLLPKLKAIENVELPLLYANMPKEKRVEKARKALETVGLGDHADYRQNQMSGGQCQRVAIARAIVSQPKLLLADEPTGALDSVSGKQVMDLFDELHQKGSTIIMITHDQKIANRAKRRMSIYDGVLTGG